MKVVILAGGKGTRISEESRLRPKPMVEIGGKPILWHIMRQYAYYGFYEFIICCGYKGHMIKEYFVNYYQNNSQLGISLKDQKVQVLRGNSEPWKVTMVDTGLETLTSGRILKVRDYIGNEPFFLTYGDGVSDVNIAELVNFHKKQNKIATMTAVNIGQRFGVLDIEENGQVSNFREKQESDGGVINGGYMVLEPQVFDYIEGDETVFEKQPLEKLAEDGQLVAYRHDGFWKCMDTQRDKIQLENLIAINNAPWMNWKR